MATRRELVVLELEDRATAGMARFAASTTLAEEAVNRLGGTSAETDRQMRPLGDSSGSVAKAERQMRAGARGIDSYSGRLGLLANTAIALGPALAPLGAVGIPLVAGFTAEVSAMALATGTAVLAFHGLGEVLDAVNKAALDPTTANLQAAQAAMDRLSPAARALVNELHNLQPVLQQLQAAGQTGLEDGLEDGLRRLVTVAPQVEAVVRAVSTELGELSTEAGKGIAGPEGRRFLEFVQTEAPHALASMGHAIGDVVHGLAELTMATAPLQHIGAGWLTQAASGFDRWATGLSQTQGVEEFATYLKENGPLVAHAVASIGNALLQLVEAAAPLGGPTLKALTAVADVLATIADSPVGTPLVAAAQALSLFNIGLRTTGRSGAEVKTSLVGMRDALLTLATAEGRAALAQEGLTARQVASSQAVTAGARTIGRAALPLGLIAASASGVAAKFHLANTASLALAGTMAGPWGAAAGGAVGLVMDLAGGQHKATVDTQTLTSTLNQQTGALTENTRAYVAQQLEQDGTLKAAQQLGLNLSVVASAALGNKDAIAEVTDALGQYQHVATNGQSVGRFGQGFNDDAAGANRLADAAGKVTGAIGDTNHALSDGRSALSRTGAAVGKTGESFHQTTTAVQAFSDTIAHLNNTLDRRAAWRTYEAAIDAVTKSIKDNGTTLDTNTEKGRANQDALDGIARAAGALAPMLSKGDRQPFLTQARHDLIDARQKFGGTIDQAQALADKLHLVDQIHANPTITIHTAHVGGGDTAYLHGGTPTTPGTPRLGTSGRTSSAGVVDPLTPRTSVPPMLALVRGGGQMWQEVSDGMQSFQQRLKDSQAALKAETDQRNATRQAAANLRSGITGGLTVDPWALSQASGNPWAAGATGGGAMNPIAALHQEKADAKRFIAAIRTLKSKGVTGPALAAIISDGDVDKAVFMASLPKSELNTYENAYLGATHAVNQAAQLGGQSIYGGTLAADDKEIAGLRAEVRALTRELKREHAHDRKNHDKNAQHVAHAAQNAGTQAASNARRRARVTG